MTTCAMCCSDRCTCLPSSNQDDEKLDPDFDVLADSSFGRAALKEMGKLGKLDPNFRLYEAGWLGQQPPFKAMEVKGAVFRRALRGPRKGRLCIIIPGTHRTVVITAEEIAAFDKRKPKK